jgi:hypothetical protein
MDKQNWAKMPPERLNEAVETAGKNALQTATTLSPAISCARATAASTPAVAKENGASGWASTQSVGTSWVTTTTGTSMVCRPPQPSVKSNSVRPQTSAPSWEVHRRQYSALRGQVESDHRRRGRELHVPALIPVEQPPNGGQKVTSGLPKKSEMKLTKKKPKNTTLTSSSTVCHHFGRAALGSLLFR